MYLTEAGVDVQAELALKNSPHIRPVRGPSLIGHASPMQKAMMSRQQQARRRPVHAAPIQNVMPSPQSATARKFGGSPTVQPTPPSQHSSPSTARSPGFPLQGGLSSPGSDLSTQQSLQHRQQPYSAQPLRGPAPSLNHHSFVQQPRTHLRNVSATAQAMAEPRMLGQLMMPPTYYSASFPKHYDQLGKLTPPSDTLFPLVELCSS